MRMFLLMLACSIACAGCVTASTATAPDVAEERPAAALVGEQFAAVAFGSDFGIAGRRLARWHADPRMHILTDRRDVFTAHRPDFENARLIFETVTGRTIVMEPNVGKATYFLALVAKRRFGEVLGRFRQLLPGIDRSIDEAEQSLCYGTLYLDTAGNIIGAVVLIDADQSPLVRRQCFLEEILQTSGAIADACHYRPSLFCEDDRRQVQPTAADLTLLRTLYDNRLQVGMTQDEAMPIARAVIAERWPY